MDSANAGVSDLERNKVSAVAFYEMMFNDCRPRAAVERYVGDNYVQHNPHVADGKDGFIAYFERTEQEWPGKHVEIRRVIAEGHFVVLHCFQHWPGDHDYAAIDIFRFDEDGKIAEHWDTLQIVATRSSNPNAMF
jgi:predicted SnoaL-like aldol condensation-catalyzing enzyme